MTKLDNILKYCDVDEDDCEKNCRIKKGYILRYERFDILDLRMFTITEHSVYFMTASSDWKETINMGLTTLNQCKLYKLEEIPLDN